MVTFGVQKWGQNDPKNDLFNPLHTGFGANIVENGPKWVKKGVQKVTQKGTLTPTGALTGKQDVRARVRQNGANISHSKYYYVIWKFSLIGRASTLRSHG